MKTTTYTFVVIRKLWIGFNLKLNALDKRSIQLDIFSYFSTKTYVVGTH